MMNKNINFLLLIALCFGLSQTIHAQELGTDDDGFVVQIKTPASIARTLVHGFDAGVCQWVGQTTNNGAMPYGVDLTTTLCGDVVWADDSLGCTPGTKDLTGKFALLRRGTCNFSLKMYHAQQRGAIAAIILNHYTGTADGPCTTQDAATGLLFGGMAAGDSASAVKIPAVFLERETGEAIDGALSAGQAVEICFAFPRMSVPTSASMYATPMSQVDTMQAITVNYNNRSGATQTNVNLKAEIFNPSGALVGTLNYNMPVVEPNVDSFAVFPPFYAPPAKGKHKVLFTNNKYNESIDSVYSYFEHTDFTFATDNLSLTAGGVGPRAADFETAGFEIQSGGLALIGDSDAKVTYATFGITNAADVYVPNDPSANLIGIAIYNADPDGNGQGELTGTGSSFSDLGAGLVSYFDYEITGNEVDGGLIHVPLEDIQSGTSGVTLSANGAYYVSLYYNGTNAGSGVSVRFAGTADVDYASFNTYPTSPVELGSLFGGGFDGAMIVQRLELDGFLPGVKVKEPQLLADSKFKLTPNPATDFVRLELKLDAINPSVRVSILDNMGRNFLDSKVEKNIQNGVMTMDVSQLNSGIYYLWIRTAEGSTMKQFVVAR